MNFLFNQKSIKLFAVLIVAVCLPHFYENLTFPDSKELKSLAELAKSVEEMELQLNQLPKGSNDSDEIRLKFREMEATLNEMQQEAQIRKIWRWVKLVSSGFSVIVGGLLIVCKVELKSESA